MINTRLKYKQEIESLALEKACPCIEAEEKSLIAYRYCYSDINHPDTFLPQSIKNRNAGKPERKNADDDFSCDNFGISLFVSEQQAKDRFYKFTQRTQELLGYTHIAEGSIDTNYGLCTPTNADGHFNLHEYNDPEPTYSFSIISAL